MACGQGTNGGRITYQSGGRLNSPRQSDNTAMVFKCIISYALFWKVKYWETERFQ